MDGDRCQAGGTAETSIPLPGPARIRVCSARSEDYPEDCPSIAELLFSLFRLITPSGTRGKIIPQRGQGLVAMGDGILKGRLHLGVSRAGRRETASVHKQLPRSPPWRGGTSFRRGGRAGKWGPSQNWEDRAAGQSCPTRDRQRTLAWGSRQLAPPTVVTPWKRRGSASGPEQ